MDSSVVEINVETFLSEFTPRNMEMSDKQRTEWLDIAPLADLKVKGKEVDSYPALVRIPHSESPFPSSYHLYRWDFWVVRSSHPRI